MGSSARAFLASVAASLATGLAFVAPLLAPTEARAGGMDPTPERLVIQPPGLPNGQTCQSIAANPAFAVPSGQTANHFSCRPDNVAFKNLASELGFAIAPTAFHPARTTGFGGFVLSLEASYTHVNADDFTHTNGSNTQYWHQGTQGSVDPSTKRFSIVNNSPDSLLGVYTLKARKGLPFGFELAGALGYVANTSLVVGGADVRWSLLEGFRRGILGYVPDISIGGGVRTLTGSSKMYLTVVGVDAQVSKPFTIGDQAVITPYLGYQHLMIYGNSAVVDSTPNVDALQSCGYTGRQPNGEPACANTVAGPNGKPVANNSDFNNDMTFDAVRVTRERMIIGVNYRLELLYLASQILFDIPAPNSSDADLSTTRQWTMSLEAGVFF
jgi:hypothetical protein